jgi:hypothetical protein
MVTKTKPALKDNFSTPIIKYLAPPTFNIGCIIGANFFIKAILKYFSGSVQFG